MLLPAWIGQEDHDQLHGDEKKGPGGLESRDGGKVKALAGLSVSLVMGSLLWKGR